MSETMTPENEQALRDAESPANVFVLRDHIRRLVTQNERLHLAIWPGLPKWEPTAEQPQQDFYEAAVESLHESQRERDRYAAAIRRHRDQGGDDRCWQDDEHLYTILPEGYVAPERDSRVELANCERFIACRHNPQTEYVSPQRRIEELEALLDRWQRAVGMPLELAEDLAATEKSDEPRAT